MINKDDDDTSHHIYGHRTNSAWYWRSTGDLVNDCHWRFLGYGRPNHWYLQKEYLEIKT